MPMPNTSPLTLDPYSIHLKMKERLFKHLQESNFAIKVREFARQALTQYENSGSKDEYCRIKVNLQLILDETINTYNVEQLDTEELLVVKDDAILLDLVSFFCRTTPRPAG